MKLVEMSAEAFTGIADEFLERTEPLLVAIQRGAGILAWAARHHLPDSHYGPWLHKFATRLGRHEDTITRWRDDITSELGLPLPLSTQKRSIARRAANGSGATLLARKPAASPPRVIELGEIGSPSVQAAVGSLLLVSAEELARATTTEQLRSLAKLFEDAMAAQNREALKARTRRARRAAG